MNDKVDRPSKRPRLLSFFNSAVGCARDKILDVSRGAIISFIRPLIHELTQENDTVIYKLKQEVNQLLEERETNLQFNIDLAFSHLKPTIRVLEMTRYSYTASDQAIDEALTAIQRLQHLITNSNEAITKYKHVFQYLGGCTDNIDISDQVLVQIETFFGQINLNLAIKKRWKDLHWMNFSTEGRNMYPMLDDGNFISYLTIDFFHALVNEENAYDVTVEGCQITDEAASFLLFDIGTISTLFGGLIYHIDEAEDKCFDIYRKYLNKVPVSLCYSTFDTYWYHQTSYQKYARYTFIFCARIIRAAGNVREYLGNRGIEKSLFDKFIDPYIPLVVRDRMSPLYGSPLYKQLKMCNNEHIDDVLFDLIMTMTPTSILNERDSDGLTTLDIAIARSESLTSKQLERLRPIETSSHTFPYDNI